MEANASNKGGQATIILVYILAYNNLGGVPMEGNVPTESGSSSRVQTGVGQEGRFIYHSIDTILCLPLSRNPW